MILQNRTKYVRSVRAKVSHVEINFTHLTINYSATMTLKKKKMKRQFKILFGRDEPEDRIGRQSLR